MIQNKEYCALEPPGLGVSLVYIREKDSGLTELQCYFEMQSFIILMLMLRKKNEYTVVIAFATKLKVF